MAEQIAFLDGFRPVSVKVLCECFGEVASRLVRPVQEAPLHMSNHYDRSHFVPQEPAPQLVLDLDQPE